VRPIALVFEAADERPLAATVLEPPRVEGAVVVASAAGVPRRIYVGVAGCLAEAGLAVLTFDYRGIGGSRQGRRLRDDDARMEDWGRLDLEGALRWMHRAYPGVPQLLLGHSAGGQLVGLAPSARRLAGAAFIGSQLGWSGNWPWPERAVMLALWYVVIPTLTSTVGYLPMQALGQGEDLPAGVGRQWAAWGRRRRYLFDALGPEVREAYAALQFPVRALHISDDIYAPRKGVEALVSFYGGKREVHTVTPAQAGTPSIGHFGWVRPRFAAAVWEPIRDWFRDRLEPSPLRRVG